MSNHRWNNNKCIKCGIFRVRATFRLFMAVTDQPPYNHYKYSTDWIYGPNETKKRPECKLSINEHQPK
jgi:hypothetical protein